MCKSTRWKSTDSACVIVDVLGANTKQVRSDVSDAYVNDPPNETLFSDDQHPISHANFYQGPHVAGNRSGIQNGRFLPKRKRPIRSCVYSKESNLSFSFGSTTRFPRYVHYDFSDKTVWFLFLMPEQNILIFVIR